MRALLLALAVGCGSPPPTTEEVDRVVEQLDDTPRTLCNVPCIGEVTSAEPISCRDVGRNLLFAREQLHRVGLVDRADFCGPFTGVRVEISSERMWSAWDGAPAQSESSPFFGWVKLSRGGKYFLHELMHVALWQRRELLDCRGAVWLQHFHAADIEYRHGALWLTTNRKAPPL